MAGARGDRYGPHMVPAVADQASSPIPFGGLLTEVPLRPLELSAFDGVLDEAGVQRLHVALAAARPVFDGRTVWNVNSTASGGGVAELLSVLLSLARGAGVDARWLVIHGDGPFFAITKRLHNRLHGVAGDGGLLGPEERAAYVAAVTPAAELLAPHVGERDVVILHDPQTAGLAPALKARGAAVVWRAHVGVDIPNDIARSAWHFLAPDVRAADVCVFSRPSFAWEVIPEERRVFISPSIDPFSPKNQELDEATVTAILVTAGLLDGPAGPAAPAFTRLDGGHGTVSRWVHVDRDRPLQPGRPFVLQVSRWDSLKDPIGVVDGFARHIAPHCDADLVFAGPDVAAVSDDPEGAAVCAQVRAFREQLPPDVRARVHLAMLPMDDPDENAAIVNALQRRAAVVVQKSLAEGFGLTVAEAMWKARPVVASALGGIGDQIEHERSGLLLEDPRDGAAFGAAVLRILHDPQEAARLGQAARERIRHAFLSDRSLVDYLTLVGRLTGSMPPAPPPGEPPP